MQALFRPDLSILIDSGKSLHESMFYYRAKIVSMKWLQKHVFLGEIRKIKIGLKKECYMEPTVQNVFKSCLPLQNDGKISSVSILLN